MKRGKNLMYERCGSIEINEDFTFDAYTQRAKVIQVTGHNFEQFYNGETAAYIQHELDHLKGITISDRNKQLHIPTLLQEDDEIKPTLIIKTSHEYKFIQRTEKNKFTPNAISFDYIEEFHSGIEKKLNETFPIK